MTNLEEGEQKLLQQVERYTEKLLKEAKEEFCTRHCNKPVIFYEAFWACHKTFPDIAIALEITW